MHLDLGRTSVCYAISAVEGNNLLSGPDVRFVSGKTGHLLLWRNVKNVDQTG